MNIFEQAPEFTEWDNRKDREVNRVTAESTYNRLSVQLPEWLVKDSTILDLGSCLGAAGHMAHPFDDKSLTFGDFKKIFLEACANKE